MSSKRGRQILCHPENWHANGNHMYHLTGWPIICDRVCLKLNVSVSILVLRIVVLNLARREEHNSAFLWSFVATSEVIILLVSVKTTTMREKHLALGIIFRSSLCFLSFSVSSVCYSYLWDECASYIKKLEYFILGMAAIAGNLTSTVVTSEYLRIKASQSNLMDREEQTRTQTILNVYTRWYTNIR